MMGAVLPGGLGDQFAGAAVPYTNNPIAPPVAEAPGPTGRYEQLLRVAKGINNLTLLARIPLLLGGSALVDDPVKREEMLQILDAVQLASGAPLLGEQARAGTYVMKNSPDTAAAARQVGSNLGTEAALQAVPIISAMLSSLTK